MSDKLAYDMSPISTSDQPTAYTPTSSRSSRSSRSTGSASSAGRNGRERNMRMLYQSQSDFRTSPMVRQTSPTCATRTISRVTRTNASAGSSHHLPMLNTPSENAVGSSTDDYGLEIVQASEGASIRNEEESVLAMTSASTAICPYSTSDTMRTSSPFATRSITIGPSQNLDDNLCKVATKSTDMDDDDDFYDNENGFLPIRLYENDANITRPRERVTTFKLSKICDFSCSQQNKRRRRLWISLFGLLAVILIIGISSGVAASRNKKSLQESQQPLQEDQQQNIVEKSGDEESQFLVSGKPTHSPTHKPTTKTPTYVPTAAPIVTFASNAAVIFSDITQEATGDMKLSVSQITFGNNSHHFFGYIGQSLTIPWNANDRYIIALESDFHDHLPQADDAARIVLIDTRNDSYKLEVLDETRAWNIQQGTMLYWNPHALDTQFFFNDRDEETNKIFTVLYDIELRKRIREYRFDGDGEYPVANGGVCPDGTFFYGLNYARMSRLRPVTGYPSTYDWTVGQRDPADDGVWKVDIKTGEQTLLASFKDIARLLKAKSIDYTPEAELYINHALSSRDCTKIYFFGRGRLGRKDMEINQPFVMGSNGNDLKLVKYIGGHPEWFNETVVFGKQGQNVVMYDVESDSVLRKVGKFDDPRGDLALSTNGNMFVNGWEDETSLYYHVVRLSDGVEAKSLPMNRGPHSGGELRIDAAPRWNRAGNKVLIPGWVDGYRQLHIIGVEGAQ